MKKKDLYEGYYDDLLEEDDYQPYEPDPHESIEDDEEDFLPSSFDIDKEMQKQIENISPPDIPEDFGDHVQPQQEKQIPGPSFELLVLHILKNIWSFIF